MNFKQLRRCGYLLTLLASTVPSVMFSQTALAHSNNDLIKPLKPSKTLVNCYCPRPDNPTFNKESKRFIPERYCPDFGGKVKNKINIDCPWYRKPSINSTSVTYPIILAKEADEGKSSSNLPSRLGVFIETLKPSVANPVGSQPAPGEDARAFRERTGRTKTEAQLDRERRDTVREVTGERHMPGGGPQDH
jgi:hypothetical protein